MSTRYEHDFYAWLQEQAALLRAGHLSALDIENLAEEIESMGASERRELHNRLKVLLHHLLKWEFQPEERSSSWRGTILEQRDQIELLLGQSPSLRQLVPQIVDTVYPKARRDAAMDTGKRSGDLPKSCPYTVEATLDDTFWPGPGS